MSDEQALKVFLNQARERANSVLGEANMSADVKSVIKDLLEVSDSFSSLMQQSQGQSADVRVLRKKLDQAKLEMKDSVVKIDNLKKIGSGDD